MNRKLNMKLSIRTITMQSSRVKTCPRKRGHGTQLQMDSRFRGNDSVGHGNDSFLFIPRFHIGGWLTGIILLSLLVNTITAQQDSKTSFEKLKADIVAKNIFRPAKTLPLPRKPDPAETTFIDPGPKPLKRPFTVLGFRVTEEQIWADLAFKDPDRVDKFKVGDMIENTVTILAIEPTYMRCNYAGLEVRIGQGETSDNALDRLLGQMSSDYVLLGTGPAPSGGEYVAYILIRGAEKYLVFEEGETLGEATIIKIEPGKVKLLDPDGTEVNLTIE